MRVFSEVRHEFLVAGVSPVPRATKYGRILRYEEGPACARAGSARSRSWRPFVRASARGATVAQVAKKHGITETTLFRWRKRFGGPTPSQATELRQLQHENARLKKVVAQLPLDIDILKDINAKKW